jgi:hypothetical protein
MPDEINTKQDICIAQMKKDIEYISEKIKTMPSKTEMFLAISEGLKDAFDNCDKKYASKNVEKVVYTLMGTVLLAVVYAILKQVGL